MRAEKPARLVRWAMRLSEYNMRIIPKSDKLNVSADALSRLPLNDNIFGHDSTNMDEQLVSELLLINHLSVTGVNTESLVNLQMKNYCIVGMMQDGMRYK